MFIITVSTGFYPVQIPPLMKTRYRRAKDQGLRASQFPKTVLYYHGVLGFASCAGLRLAVNANVHMLECKCKYVDVAKVRAGANIESKLLQKHIYSCKLPLG